MKYLPKLLPHFPDYNSNDTKAIQSIEQFIRHNNIGDTHDRHNFIVKNARKIKQLLDTVKICDPAIGSGAFPIGLLKEIFEAKLALDLTLDRAQTKKDIIQNNIYGVDMEKGAVDIARLRFWLALVVDEEIPQPLPNLDYKIMQGNSLLESYEGVDLKFEAAKFSIKAVKEVDLWGKPVNPQISITEYLQTMQHTKEFDITQLENEYFNSNNASDKKRIRKKIDEFEKTFIKEQLNKYITDKKAELTYKQKEQKNILSHKISVPGDIADKATKNAYLRYLKDVESKNKEIESIEKEISNLKSKQIDLDNITPDSKPYFLWNLYFMDVFKEGGFDIVIGNPPYIAFQRMEEKDRNPFANLYFETFEKTGDIYSLFYEKGINWLKSNGVLCLITSNKWISANYGVSLREFLLKNANPLQVLDFGKNRLFEHATVFVNILLAQKTQYNSNTLGCFIQEDYTISSSLLDYVQKNKTTLKNLTSETWKIADSETAFINKKLLSKGAPLNTLDVYFYRGITTGLNEAFHIDEETKNRIIKQNPKSNEIIKPLLRGKDIKRYKYKYEDLYIIFTKQGVDIENYPAVSEYLSGYKEQLTPKQSANEKFGRKPGSYKWYEIQDNTAYYFEFEKPKIVWIEISDKGNYAFDDTGMYLTNSAYFLTSDTQNLKYLIAILNSKVSDFWFFQITAKIAGGRKRYTGQYVEQVLIPKTTEKNEKLLEMIVDYLIYLSDLKNPKVNKYIPNSDMISVFEEVLNYCVFELFFEEHMKEEKIDVIQFLDLKPINELSNPNEVCSIIDNTYNWLQHMDNPIRNRVIRSEMVSPHIIGYIKRNTL